LQNDLLYVKAFVKGSEITWATASPNLAAQKIGVVDVVLPGAGSRRFCAVKRPARPYKRAIENRFTMEKSKGA
jgi:hypothetical protein